MQRERKNQNVKNVLTHPVGDVELRVAGEDVDSITVENVVKVVTIHCLYLVTYLSIIQNIIINNYLSRTSSYYVYVKTGGKGIEKLGLSCAKLRSVNS